MTTAVTIEVKRRDILLGKRRSSSSCPIAKAIRRRLKKPIRVGSRLAWLGTNNTTIGLPMKARDFISRFDGGLKVKPFSFELMVPK